MLAQDMKFGSLVKSAGQTWGQWNKNNWNFYNLNVIIGNKEEIQDRDMQAKTHE